MEQLKEAVLHMSDEQRRKLVAEDEAAEHKAKVRQEQYPGEGNRRQRRMVAAARARIARKKEKV